MEMDKALMERLLKENEEFKKAYLEHREYDKKVEQMEKKGFLSTAEMLEKKRLKKLKLKLKDQMEEIISREVRRS